MPAAWAVKIRQRVGILAAEDMQLELLREQEFRAARQLQEAVHLVRPER